MAEVLRASSPYDGHEYFAQNNFRHSSPSQSSLLGSSPTYPSQLPRRSSQADLARSSSQSDLASFASSPNLMRTNISRTSSFYSTPPSSLSFGNKFGVGGDDDDDDDDDEEICFPTYNKSPSTAMYHPEEFVPPASPATDESLPSPDLAEDTASPSADSPPSSPGLNPVVDDTAVRDEPSRQVDYLSHNWREEDIWSSWKHIVSKRRYYGERSRLENASWRTWAKSKYQLKTVTPETLNWLKDCDVTWLYGPLQQGNSEQPASGPANQLANNSVQKKPILKKRSMSEVMLQKSISTSSLVKEAAIEVQAQRTGGHRGLPRRRPVMGRAQSDYGGATVPMTLTTAGDIAVSSASESSGPASPDNGKRHIRFDNNVEQCIAVEFKQGEEEETFHWTRNSDSSDDELVMKPKTRKRAPTTASRQNSFSQESKGIAKLPSTTLKYHAEDPECPGHPAAKQTSSNVWRFSPPKIVQSDSQETLKPSRSSGNFLLDEEDDDADMSWEPSGAFGGLRRDSVAGSQLGVSILSSSQTEEDDADEVEGAESSVSPGGLRRTPSGMFMPFEGDDEAENLNNPGFLGKVVDTVNTARDIAHVIWNVGWRK